MEKINKTTDGNSHGWDYAPPKWWRVSLIALPPALLAEFFAILITFGPRGKPGTAQIVGIALCVAIPIPLIWLRNGNHHLKDLLEREPINPQVLKLISFFVLGITMSSYVVIGLLVVNLFIALR